MNKTKNNPLSEQPSFDNFITSWLTKSLVCKVSGLISVYCVPQILLEAFPKVRPTLIVRRISASFQYNCAINGKGLKIGTKEADTT